MRICVIGCGQLGAKIAGELVLYGHRVKVFDRDSHKLDTAHSQIINDREHLRRDGLLTAAQEQAVGQLYCLSNLQEAVHDAELIVESIIEDLAAKQQIFAEISQHCCVDAILSSNSLTLNLDEVFSQTTHTERSLGMRFLYPVYCIPEIEITPHRSTSPDTINNVRRFISAMGKMAFLRGDRPVILTEEERELRRMEAAAAGSLSVQMNSLSDESTNHGSLHFSKLALAARSPLSLKATGSQGDTHVTNNNTGKTFNHDCAVCLDNARDTVLEPCRHLVTCMACAKTLQRRRDACPVCRSPIVDVIHVFNS